MFFSPSMAARRVEGPLLLLWILVNTIPVLTSPTPTTCSEATAVSSTAAATISLSSSITHFIPSCALSCFESFIAENFNTSVCGTSPSLECLCQHTGSTGYTIGEGATECIVAENDINHCHGMDFGSSTVTEAYSMCSNQTNAAPETHATLIATLIVNSGSIVVADPTITSSSNQTSTRMSVTPTSTSSTLATTTSATATSASIIPTSSGTANATAPTSTGFSHLSGGQVAGITTGCVAAAVITALLALLLYIRRRKGFARVRDSWNDKKVQGSPSSLPISAPQYQEPKVMSFTRALAKQSKRFSRGGDRPGTIGLAIGSESALVGGPTTPTPASGTDVGTPLPERRPNERLVIRNIPPTPPQNTENPTPPVPPMSPGRAVSSFRFFPDKSPKPQQQTQTPVFQNLNHPHKPNLAIAIPPPRAKRVSTASANRNLFNGGRDSVVTEFAEDGEDSATAPGSALIWRPPNTDPQSATTYYVADKWGNWVLGQGAHPDAAELHTHESPAELATPISKTAEEREAELRRRQRQPERPEVDTRVQDSEAVRAALTHLSSPTIPEAVALGIPGRARGRARGGGAPGRSTIRLVTPESGRLPINSRSHSRPRSRGRSNSSSVYSSHNPSRSVEPTPENPLPSSAGTMGPEAFYAVRDGKGAGGAELSRGGSGKGSGKRRRSRSDVTGFLRRRSTAERDQPSRESATTIMSMDSATTISDSPVEGMNAALDEFPMPKRVSSLPPEKKLNLSPVAESPVRYPDIPRSQSGNQGKNFGQQQQGQGPRPLNPAVARMRINPAAAAAAAGPVRDSPTLGMLGSAQSGQARTYSLTAPGPQARRASPNPYPDRNPGAVRSGSPPNPPSGGPDNMLSVPKQQQEQQQRRRAAGTDRAGLPSQTHAQAQAQARARPQSRYGPMSSYDAYNDPGRLEGDQPALPPAQKRPPLHRDLQAPPQQQQRPYLSPTQQQQQQQHRHHQHRQQVTPPPPSPSQTFLPSPPSASEEARYGSGTNTTSSPDSRYAGAGGGNDNNSPPPGSGLLAKRLGAERAAKLQIEGQPGQGRPGKWAKQGPAREAAGTEEVVGEPAAGDRGTYVNLPATPGWKPQLTPKKKGRDLYLSVR